jgi:hypothetical protein
MVVSPALLRHEQNVAASIVFMLKPEPFRTSPMIAPSNANSKLCASIKHTQACADALVPEIWYSGHLKRNHNIQSPFMEPSAP